MWIVAYRIIYPFLFASILFFIEFLILYFSWKKKKSKKKLDVNKQKKISIRFLILSLTAFSYSAYLSFDIIFKDYIVNNGIYLKDYRGKDIITSELYFDIDGEVISIDIFTSNIQDYGFEPGEAYEITYSKRTNMLISARDY